MYEATLNLSSSTTLDEWVRLLDSAGIANGATAAIRYSLSAVGFWTEN